jgi:hypothetical protein
MCHCRAAAAAGKPPPHAATSASLRTRAQDVVRRVRHRPRVLAENTVSSAGHRGRLGSRQRALARALECDGHAPVGRPHRSWGARTRPPGHCSAGPGGPFFSRKLCRTSGNRPRAGFGNLKSLFHFLGYFKSDSNFQNSYQINLLSKKL